MRRLFLITLLSFSAAFMSLFGSVQAETISQNILPINIKAEAEYLTGEKDKAAVLILHGFLATKKFHTISGITQALHEEGYTTLAPTLTLNVPQRRTTVKCNAIHTHTLEQDFIEIEAWVNWLKVQGHKKIIVIGHSSGSLSLLHYLTTAKSPSISLAIFTSLFYLNGEELGTDTNDIKMAKNLLETQSKKPNFYSFLFCHKNYYATPESYLSYLAIDRKFTLDNLNKLTIPNYTIMGTMDERYQKVGLNWLDELRATPTQVMKIEGASHFFSSEYEFELQDYLIQILNDH